MLDLVHQLLVPRLETAPCLFPLQWAASEWNRRKVSRQVGLSSISSLGLWVAEADSLNQLFSKMMLKICTR